MPLVGLLLEGDFEPPPQVPPLTIRPGQVLKTTATVKNVESSDKGGDRYGWMLSARTGSYD